MAVSYTTPPVYTVLLPLVHHGVPVHVYVYTVGVSVDESVVLTTSTWCVWIHYPWDVWMHYFCITDVAMPCAVLAALHIHCILPLRAHYIYPAEYAYTACLHM